MTTAVDMSVWQGRVDAEDGDAGRRWHQVVRPYQPDAAPGVVLVGFASDAGVARNRGRVGAADGPRALRRSLAGLAYHGAETVPLLDAGDVRCEGDALEAAQSALAGRIGALLAAGHFPLVLGGGHEVAWGTFQGVVEILPATGRSGRTVPPERLGIVNFDAHFDLRRPVEAGRGTSGTPFFQIGAWLAGRALPLRYLCLGISEAANTPALFATARQYGVRWLTDEELVWPELARACRMIDEFVADVDAIQLSFCLDVLPGSVAPGVSAPAARGVPTDVALALLHRVLGCAGHGGAHSKLLVAEIAELNPRFDQDERTARLAARIAYELAAPVLARTPVAVGWQAAGREASK